MATTNQIVVNPPKITMALILKMAGECRKRPVCVEPVGADRHIER